VFRVIAEELEMDPKEVAEQDVLPMPKLDYATAKVISDKLARNNGILVNPSAMVPRLGAAWATTRASLISQARIDARTDSSEHEGTDTTEGRGDERARQDIRT